MALVRFMEGISGRTLRVVLGVAMIVVGAVLGGGWIALSVVGLVPLAAGAFNFCLLAPLFHAPLHSAGTHS